MDLTFKKKWAETFLIFYSPLIEGGWGWGGGARTFYLHFG